LLQVALRPATDDYCWLAPDESISQQAKPTPTNSPNEIKIQGRTPIRYESASSTTFRSGDSAALSNVELVQETTRNGGFCTRLSLVCRNDHHLTIDGADFAHSQANEWTDFVRKEKIGSRANSSKVPRSNSLVRAFSHHLDKAMLTAPSASLKRQKSRTLHPLTRKSTLFQQT